MVERGTLPGQRTVDWHARGHRRRAWRRRTSGRRRSRSSGPVAALRDTIAWLERRPLHGAGGGGDARPRAGERPRGAAARAGRRGGGDAGDPDRAAAGRGRAPGGDRADRGVLARLPDQPERREAALRSARRGGATPARSPARPWRRSVRAPPPSSRAAAFAPTWCRSASWPRRSSRRSRACRSRGGACSWRAPRRRATCSPTALRDAAPRSTTWLSTRPWPSRSPRRSAAALERATYVTFTSSSTVRFLVESRRPARRRRAVVSIGPVTSATAARARPDGGRRGRAARHRRAGRRSDRGRDAATGPA